ncbi:hypothetical protein Vadar_009970 [Vaccinium darrowii]|uniref:Uncharacterized protein n=1 Tax=Vaccinium darrowii TaxID=229202 RepID=A0ACB7YV71_9ERIC|nr:hypothetical protein Vadar_009970 [Vaccinium darrowii]
MDDDGEGIYEFQPTMKFTQEDISELNDIINLTATRNVEEISKCYKSFDSTNDYGGNIEKEMPKVDNVEYLKSLLIENFSTREELIARVHNVASMEGYVTTIRRSKADRYVVIGCDRGKGKASEDFEPIEVLDDKEMAPKEDSKNKRMWNRNPLEGCPRGDVDASEFLVLMGARTKMGGFEHGLLGEYIWESGNRITAIGRSLCVQIMVQSLPQSSMLATFVINRSRRSATVVALPSYCTQEALVYVAEECPDLRNLELPRNLDSDLMLKIPNLISKWKNLEHLTLNYSFEIPIIAEISIHCKNFYSLTVRRARIGSDEASAIVTLLPNIRYLELSDGCVLNENLLRVLQGCKELVHLDSTKPGDSETLQRFRKPSAMTEKNASGSESLKRDATLDVSDPYSLHHSDHPENLNKRDEKEKVMLNKRDEKEKVMQFLMGLNENYAPPSSSSDGPRLTTEEYNQVMAMIRKNNDGNSPHFANATEIQPFLDPITPKPVEPVCCGTDNPHNNTSSSSLSSIPNPTEPTTLDSPPVQPPSPIPCLCRSERVKQPNTMLRDFHLYNMAMVVPGQSPSLSGISDVRRDSDLQIQKSMIALAGPCS